MFDAKGPMGFVDEKTLERVIDGFLNSRVASFLLRMLAPTLDFKLTHVLSLPFQDPATDALDANVASSILLAKSDWDAFENSWDFLHTTSALLRPLR